MANGSETLHPQTWAKVNASVDVGVLPLVEALSAFPALQTFESCEGIGDEPMTVWFTYGHSDTELATFFAKVLAAEIKGKIPADVELSLWANTFGQVHAEIAVPRSAAKRVARLIRRVAAKHV